MTALRIVFAGSPVAAVPSLDALIDSGVDAVVITTPPETRRELVLREFSVDAMVDGNLRVYREVLEGR